MSQYFQRVWQATVHMASFEWLLSAARPNGGDVILARATGVALLLVVITLTLRNLIDPDLHGPVSWQSLRKQMLEIAPWFAGALGVVYAALYARFSSQWSYLANLYNVIKQAEIELLCASPPNLDTVKTVLSEWKAGYIEDAEDLHLHTKANVSAIIDNWGGVADVRVAFVNASAGGQKRWDRLYEEAKAANAKAAGRYR